MAIAEKEPSYFLQRKQLGNEQTFGRLEQQIQDLERRVEATLLSQDAFVSRIEKRDVEIWGVPFTRFTLEQTLRYVDELIESGEPGYFITANLNYNMLTSRSSGLDSVNRNARFIVCDGMPMIWWSRVWTDTPLPERVAGSELIYALTNWAAIRGHRVYFLGGAPGIAQSAAERLSDRYPDLNVVGVESPPFRPLTQEEETAMIDRIRASRADIVYVALGQPRGENWIAQHCEKLGAPVCVQIGASFDFVAGGVARAPRWMQQIGLEWCYRMLQEPKRLTARYVSNAAFLMGAIARDLMRRMTSWRHG